jgi:DNA replication protein DnaC
MFWGETRTPYCLCKCAEEKLKEEEEKLKKEEFIRKIKKLRKMGFPDKEVANCRFEKNDSPDEVYSRAALNYVERFSNMLEGGKGVIFHGAVGTGKTFISACIANALIDKGYPCLVTNFARLVNTISGMYEGKQKYIDGLNDFDLLVIDDLAAERDTEYMNETVQNIIDSRYRLGKPLIVTTNLTEYELKNPTDVKKQRTYSRLLNMCFLIEVSGPDRRRKKHADDYLKYKALLGLE